MSGEWTDRLLHGRRAYWLMDRRADGRTDYDQMIELQLRLHGCGSMAVATISVAVSLGLSATVVANLATCCLLSAALYPLADDGFVCPALTSDTAARVRPTHDFAFIFDTRAKAHSLQADWVVPAVMKQALSNKGQRIFSLGDHDTGLPVGFLTDLTGGRVLSGTVL